MALSTEYTLLNDIDNAINQNLILHNHPFIVGATITRPANVTAYAKNDVINGDTLTVPINIDLSLLGTDDNSIIEINGIEIMSSNPSGLLNCNMYFVYGPSIGAQSLVDNVAFNPSNNDSTQYEVQVIENISTLLTTLSTNIYFKKDIRRQIPVTPYRALNIVLLTNAAYTPTSGEKIQITLTGKFL